MKFITKFEDTLSSGQIVEVTYIPALKEWRLLIGGRNNFDPPEIYKGNKNFITNLCTEIIKNDVLDISY